MTINKRRHYFIEKRLQTKYALLVISMLVLYTMVLLTAIFAPYVMALFSSNLSLSQKGEAADVLLLLHKSIWPGIGLIILLFGALSIFVTHKFAGPVYVIERMARNMADGNLTLRAKLRDGDDLEDLAGYMNQLADNMESLLVSLNYEHDKLSSYIVELERELKEKDISEQSTAELAHKIGAEKDNIGRILERYSYKGKPKGS